MEWINFLMKSKIIFLVLWLICRTGAELVLAQQEDSYLTGALNNSTLLGDAGEGILKSSTLIPAVSEFSWLNLIGCLIFNGIGLVAFTYGKKQGGFRPLIIGIALMIYPYFFTKTFWLYAIGIGLCAALYYWRD